MNLLHLRKKHILSLFVLFAAFFIFDFVSLAPIGNAQAISGVGAKRLLVIRVDFSDKPGVPLDGRGDPFTVQKAQDLYSQVNDFFVKNSYNKTSVSATVMRLPT